MGKYIKFGEFNKNDKYIIFATLCHFASDFFLKDNSFFSEEINNIRNHSIIHDFYFHIIISIISYILYKKSFQSESTTNDENEDKKTYKIILNIIIIVTFWILIEFIEDILSNLNIVDAWIIGLLMITLVNYIIFKQEIYKHQKFAIYFNIIAYIILQIMSYYINDDILNIIYKNNKWLIPIAAISILLLSFFYAYIIAKIKWFMELKYISSQKLLIYYGVIGIIIYAFVCLLLSYIKCNELFENSICEIFDNKDNYYIENIFIYFHNLSNSNKGTIIQEIIIMLFGMIFYVLYIYFEVLIIYYLTPVHYFFYDSAYEFLLNIAEFIFRLIEKEDLAGIIIEIVGDIFALIGFFIYLEIIELNFCKLNYNIRKKIIERGIEDSNTDIDEDDNNLLFNRDSDVSELSSKIN